MTYGWAFRQAFSQANGVMACAETPCKARDIQPAGYLWSDTAIGPFGSRSHLVVAVRVKREIGRKSRKIHVRESFLYGI